MKKCVVFSPFGSQKDSGMTRRRWNRWRPSLSLVQQEDFVVDRLELLVQPNFLTAAQTLEGDIRSVSPETKVQRHEVPFQDPWDFEEVFEVLHDLAINYPFDPEREDYFVHITTGTHVVQICLFLLTETRFFPGKLIQSSPPAKGQGTEAVGNYRIIDLDLSRYDRIAARFREEREKARDFLKSGIATRNPSFNRLIARMEQVALASRAPMLLMGPTGAGKSHLARRIYQLKKKRQPMSGNFVDVNCATLRGDAAMSTLFGHVRGAFTGALQDRQGLLRTAHGGLLFLDEIGELGPDEQAMLLRALEEKAFFPMGSDREIQSDFQLIAGTNRDLWKEVAKGRFREDLLARINLWTFTLPGLRDRPEDIEPNVQFELEQFARLQGRSVTFNKEAMGRFLEFATGPKGLWRANFRDLNGAINRMATLAGGKRIDTALVAEEIDRLNGQWQAGKRSQEALSAFLNREQIAAMDLFDKLQLERVLNLCRQARSLADAGRRLFSASRLRKKSFNDSDRLRKYLLKFGITPDHPNLFGGSPAISGEG